MKIRQLFSSAFNSVSKAVKSHPSAVIILLFCSIVTSITDFDPEGWLKCVIAAPVCVVSALAIDYFFPEGRKWSWISVVALALCALIPGLENWTDSDSYWIITFVVLPLVMILYRKSYDDVSYIKHAVWLLWTFFLSGIACSLILGLLYGVVSSVDVLFNTSLYDDDVYLISFAYILCWPVLFIGASEKENIPGIRRILDVTFNWILSPALVLYTAVLLAYVIKIVFTWTLPCGNVAGMCFTWGLAAFCVSAVQPLLSRNPFKWFTSYSGYISIPFVILLWVSVIRRILDYGFTTSRYFLIICGVVLTVFMAVSLIRNGRMYYIVTAVTAVLFAVGASVPGISYKSVTIASQTHRVRQLASELGALSEDGTLLLHPQEGNEEVAANLKDALKVINNLDGSVLQKEFGIVDYNSYLSGLDPELKVEIFLKREENNRISVEGFSQMLVWDNSLQYGALFLDGSRLSWDDMLLEQLSKAGVSAPYSEELLRQHSSEFLEYDMPGKRIIFKSMTIGIDEYGKAHVVKASLSGVLYR